MDSLQKIKEKIEQIQAKSAVSAEMKAFITLVLSIVNKSKEELKEVGENNLKTIKEAIEYISKEHEKILSDVSSETENSKKELDKQVKKVEDILAKIEAMEFEDGDDGYTPEKGKDYFTEDDKKELCDMVKKEIPEHECKEIEGEEIVFKINKLPLEKDFQIDASHIKNLPSGNGDKYYGGSGIKEVIAGTNVTIDNSNYGFPVISASGGVAGGSTEHYIPFGASDGTLEEESTLQFYKATDTLVIGETPTNSLLDNDALIITKNIDDYAGVYIQNKSNGVTAYTDLILGNDADSSGIAGNYVDLGKCGSGYVAEDSGQVSTVTIHAIGSGYTAGDILQLNEGNDDCTIEVISVNGSGGVTEIAIVTNGTGYSIMKNVTTEYVTGSGGSGLTVDIKSLYDNTILSASDAYLINVSGHLCIGTDDTVANKYVKFFTGGLGIGNQRGYIEESGWYGMRTHPRTYSTTTTLTLTPEIENYDIYNLTALTSNLTIANHVDSVPTDGEELQIIITSDATARSLSYGTNYLGGSCFSLPATTPPSRTMRMVFRWSGASSKWILIWICYPDRFTPVRVYGGSSVFTGMSSASSSATLTGTVDPDGTIVLSGTGTLFLYELNVGDRITVNGETRKVTTIATNTRLTVDTAFSDTAPGATITRLTAILIGKTSAGTSKFIVDDLGNVSAGGVNTYDSTSALCVVGQFRVDRLLNASGSTVTFGNSAGTNGAVFTGGNTASFLFTGTTSATIGTSSNAPVIFKANNTDYGRISNSTGYWGFGGSFTPTNLISLSGQSAQTIWMERNTTSNTAGNNLTIQSGGATSGATDKDGGMFTLAPGLSTGTGKSSIRQQRLFRAISTGTSDNTLADATIVPARFNLTNSSANALFTVALPSLAGAGGSIDFTIHVSDGTDIQRYTSRVDFSAVNKGGSYTTNITEYASPSKSLSAGTLTTSWTITTGTNIITINVTPASSLTPTLMWIEYTIPNIGAGANAVTQL